jgi:hypothetical protein
MGSTEGVFIGRKKFRDSSYSFTKLDSKIIYSSVWMEPMPTKIVWITMLAMCDQYGRVGASVPGLARAAGVTVAQCHAALEKFLAPDPQSRNPKNEGRRIEVIDRGWRVLNYEENRAQVDEEHQRRRKAKNQQDFRDRKKSLVTGNVTGDGYGRLHVSKNNPKAEADISASQICEQRTGCGPDADSPDDLEQLFGAKGAVNDRN